MASSCDGAAAEKPKGAVILRRDRLMRSDEEIRRRLEDAPSSPVFLVGFALPRHRTGLPSFVAWSRLDALGGDRGAGEHNHAPMTNQRIVFFSRPGVTSAPSADCFRCEPCPEPTKEDLLAGQSLVKTLYLSVDPAQRCRMNESSGVDYLDVYEEGELVDGMEGVGQVVDVGPECSLQPGDIVTSCAHLWPWTEKFIADAEDLVKAQIKQGTPQTIVVSAAAGSCGSLVGQIARLEGCTKVIGICSSAEKCSVITQEFGFNAAINYNSESISDRLHSIAPEGVDIYWDNVGGFISDAVIQNMNAGGRIVLCGQISVYNTDLPYPPPLTERTENIVREKGISRDRYLVLRYKDEFDAAVAQLSRWLLEGKLKARETVREGLARAPQAFVDLMAGKNIGKMVVKVSEPGIPNAPEHSNTNSSN